MKIKNNQQPSKGFLIVASRTHNFYRMAINCMESIRDYFPDAKICLVTEKRFCDGREKAADHIIYCEGHIREKLWAMTKTPFDVTMYIDADSEVKHEDITKAFDELKDHDLVFSELTKEREYCYAIRTWPGGEFTLCGGVVLYDMRNPLVKQFIHDWNYYYREQAKGRWWPEYNDDGTDNYDIHPSHLRKWDQFTLWWLTKGTDKYKDLKIGIFEDDARWNWFSLYTERLVKINKPPIIHHLSALANKGNMGPNPQDV